MSAADPRPPAGQFQVPTAKLTKYLLNLEHPKGGAEKARFFLAFGFTVAAWEEFAGALREHGAGRALAKVVPVEVAALASAVETWVVECALTTPDGRNPCVRSVWRSLGSGSPQFVTAYPNPLPSALRDPSV